MKTNIAAFLLLVTLWLPSAIHAQKGLQIGAGAQFAMAFSQESSAPPAGVNPSLFLRPAYSLQFRWLLSKGWSLETGLWAQAHGTRTRYTVDFGTQAGNPNFWVNNSRSGILAIPLWLGYSPGASRWRFSAGLSCLLNPVLDSRIESTVSYDGGTSDVLYLRTVSEITPFFSVGLSGRAEYAFVQKNGHSLVLTLSGQLGFSEFRSTLLELSVNDLSYEQSYLRGNRGDFVGLGVGYWFFRKDPARLDR